ncbi:MAG: polyphenol oxidase family protein [Muribaculum sp.]|nr:polyphenol oxidase family protein [Muribaculum sp.]
MRIPNHKVTDFLIPLFLGEKVDVFTTSRGVEYNGENPYSGFSLCHYTGDSPAHYQECRRLLSICFDVASGEILAPRQTHGSKCIVVNGAEVDGDLLEGVDGLVTARRGRIVGVNTADCLPVVMVDDEQGIAGVAHAGWRGALNGIVQSTLGEMLECGASIGRIKVFMAPCICPGCFEVGPEVAALFPAKNQYMDAKPHVDLAGYVGDCLVEMGVRESMIHLPKECTKCNPEKYFSARASGIASGRNFTFAVIK